MFDVFLFDPKVGSLESRPGGRVRFTYAAEALDDARVGALSLALPKRAEPFGDRACGPFFRNLLPEAAYRRLVAAAAGTRAGEDAALLGAIGGECPGAVSIWPAGARPSGPPRYRPLDASALAGLVDARDPAALGSAVARGRLSLPGVQEKIALLKDADGGWQLPLEGAITSHILKAPTTVFPGLLENELFTLRLAALSGLVAVRATVAAPAVRALAVERFDRVAGGPPPGLAKLHQEDFCQLLGAEPSRKYEFDGGPGLRGCAAAIREHAALPARDLERLARWVCFNYLVGNEDAHAKNLALVYRPEGLELAPLYDLVSTAAYPSLERRMAMKIGGAVDLRNVQRADWERFAGPRGLGLPAAVVRGWLLEQADAVVAALGGAEAACAAEGGPSAVYGEIAGLCRQQAQRLERELAR